MMTWSSDWISDCESLWSILQKYKLANVLSSDYVRKTYQEYGYNAFDEALEKVLPSNFNYSLLSSHLNFCLNKYFKSQIENWALLDINPSALVMFIANELRYCPECINSGFHSNLHQLYIVKYCPFHTKVKLVEKCTSCRQPISLEPASIRNLPYTCKCGQLLVASDQYSVLKKLWKYSAAQNFNEALLKEKQFIILHTPLGTSIEHSLMYTGTNHYLSIINNNLNHNLNRGAIDITSVYKCYLRRIRRSCKYRCYKKQYRNGILTELCRHCQAYYKLRSQFEIINNDWDLLSKNRGIILKPTTCCSIDQNLLKSIKNHLQIDQLSQLAIYNLETYMLYHNLKASFQFWICYITEKSSAKYNTLRFSVRLHCKQKLNLLVEY